MVQILYKALADGISKLIKNGLAFTVMTAVIIGLCWFTIQEIEAHANDRLEWKSELKEVRNAHYSEISLLRSEVYECNNNRALLAARVAELEATVKYRTR